MDEKDYNKEKQPGYDADTFGEVKRDNFKQGQYGYDQQSQYGQQHTQGSYSQNTYGQSAQNTRQTPPGGNGFGIVSMVLGILALVFFCSCMNIPLAAISIILAIIHISGKNGSNGFAIAGIVTSLISVILTVIMIAAFLFVGVGTDAWINAETLPFEYFMDDEDFYDDYYDYDGDSDDFPIDGHHHGHDL